MTAGRAPSRAVLVLALAAAAVVVAHAAPGTAPIRGLTEAARLARAFDLVYDADFAGADAALSQTCPPAPAQACGVIGVAARWWRLFFDVDNRSGDAAFVSAVNRTIDQGEAWVTREPARAEAWFYLGAAYGARVQFHAQRSEFMAAARDGKRIKTSLEQAIALDPDLHDAYFGVGLYQYYADIAPAALKLLRWLLLLPGGDKTEGMAQMLRTRDRGLLVRAEAAYQLHLIDLWYEKKPDHALQLLGELHARYPHNPLFVLNTAQVYEIYKSDRGAALRTYRSLVEGARAGAFREPQMAEAWGHLGAAPILRAQGQPDRALDEAQWVVDHAPAAPYGAVALAQLEAGRAHAAAGRRDRAATAFRAAIAAAPGDDPRHVKRDAQRALDALR